MKGIPAAVCVLLLCGVFISVFGEQHSLYYIYSSLNKNVDLPGIYDFTAMGLLDDREIDYYNSKDQMKIPKQDWMREKMQADYWEKGTQSRKSKEQWFKVNVDILMNRMGHNNNSGLHVLQWRHGCEIDESDGAVKFLKGIDEYSYDGSEFLSFDDKNMRWIAPVPAAEPTKRKWDDVPILNQYTKGYLEKECVDWLTKFMEYGKESLRKHSPPDVQLFAKTSVRDPRKLTLTCLATGFYPKDVMMSVRKYRTALPEHLLTSSGVRPNDDETYQLRKSVEIQKEDEAQYDCFVTHITLKEPIIKRWVPSQENNTMIIVGIVIAMLLIVIVVLGAIFYRKKKRARDPAAEKGPAVGVRAAGNGQAGRDPTQKLNDTESGRGSSDGSNEDIKNSSSGSSDVGYASKRESPADSDENIAEAASMLQDDSSDPGIYANVQC